MQKNTPTEFARLGFSCLIQSGLDSNLFLQAPPNSSSSNSDLLSVCPIDKLETQQDKTSIEWFIEASEEKGYFHLVSAIDVKRPLLLHLGENFEQNGDPISLVEKNRAFENTKLRFDEVPGLDGYYHMSFYQASGMASRTTDSKRVVHVDEDSKQHVTLYERIQSPACYWRFILARLSPSDLIASNEFNCFAMENKTGGFLTLKGGSIFNGTLVTTGQFTNQTTFKWRIKSAGKDQYFIVSARDAHHDRVLQQHENSQDDGAKITLWEFDSDNKNNAASSSMVKFEPAGDEGGHWNILFCHSNKYLQMRLGEVSQVGKKRNQQLDANCCWSFVRCIPNFPKNA